MSSLAVAHFRVARRLAFAALPCLLLALMMIGFPARQRAAALRSLSMSEPSAPTDFTISLRGFCFDPKTGDPAREHAKRGGYLTEMSGDGYRLVQLGGRTQDAWLRQLQQMGVEPVQYIPHQTYLAYVPATAREAAEALSFVRWMGPYHPIYKLSPELQWVFTGKAGKPADDGTYLVATFKRAGLETAVRRVATVGKVLTAEVMPSGTPFDVLRVRLTPQGVAAAAELQEVMAIEPYVPPTLEDERNAHITAGNYTGTGIDALAAPGYNPQAQFGSNGSGVSVGVVDDGVEIPSPQGFYITAANAVAGPPRGADGATSFRGGHGHLCASIIAGATPFPDIRDPRNYNYGLGVAPGAHLVSVPFITGGSFQGGDATAVNDTVTTLPPNGARATISNNSWGAGVATDYGTREAQYDAFTQDASQGEGIDPLLFVFSAGNSGPNDGTLTRPKAAKNIVTVGSSVGLRPELPPFSGIPNTSIDFLSNFSSRGPAADGRVKPDVCAPGQRITGPRSTSGQVGSQLGDGIHIHSSGTSFAAPHVSGAAALFTGWWRANNGGQIPAPALVKAALINGAVDMNAEHPGEPSSSTTAPIPNSAEGWGRVNVRRSIPSGLPTAYVNESVALLDVGQTYVFTGQVANGGQPVRVTLAYSDAPGAPGANPALVNDLDLLVTVGGQTYRGNVFANGLSVPGGSADGRNNVENVFLPPQPAGTPIIARVIASALNGNGILGNSDPTDQHFGLVISNAVATAPTTPLLAATNVTATEQGGNGNGAIEPCEVGALTVQLRNDGTPATGLSATLTALTPGVVVTSGSGAFPNLGTGQTATGPTPAFQFTLGADVPCGQVVQFQLTVNFAGGGSFVTTLQVPTGFSGGNYAFASSTGATIPAGGQLVAGSQLDDALVPLTAPFGFSVYTVNVAAGATLTADTNGILRLVGGGGSLFGNQSLPTGGTGSAPALFVFWDDIDLTAQQGGSPRGIFTQVTGSAPNREWIVEWRGARFGTSEEIHVAVVLREGTNRFEYRYAQTGSGNGDSATVGVQAGPSGPFTQFSFNQGIITPGLRLDAQLPTCAPCVACDYVVTPTTLSLPGDIVPSATLTVTTSPSCAWEARVRNVDAPWIKLISAQLAGGQVVTPRMVGQLGDVNRRLAISATGSATLTFAVGRNPSAAPRTGTFFVAGQVVTVTQAGSAGPSAPVGSTMAMFRPSNGYMYLKNRLISDFADNDFFYGLAGDTPLAGDWDGDGIDTPGIYRNVNGVMTFFLINNNTGGFADISFGYGQPGDIPLAGDWDGNGTVTCGVYRPGSQTFFLRNALSAGNPDLTVTITGSQANDVPLAGRWTAGNPATGVGLYRPSTGQCLLKQVNLSGAPDTTFTLATTGTFVAAVAGDWTRQGFATVGVVTNIGGTIQFQLRNSHTSGGPDIRVNYGVPGDVPLIGNWDGQLKPPPVSVP